MNRGEPGTPAAMTLIRPEQRQPVRVTLAHETELVRRGFAEMMAPYGSRVDLAPGFLEGRAPQEADLMLHDPVGVAGRECHEWSPPVHAEVGRLVVYTWNPRPDLVEQALTGGAAGFLAKSLPAPQLVAALEAIHRGRTVVECGGGHDRSGSLPIAPLTAREAEVISLITRGFDNHGIAREMYVSINSVKTYIRSAYRKMGVRSRTQAVLWGVRHGYLDEPVPVPTEPALTG